MNPHANRKQAPTGFALVITISMMVILVVVAIGLLSLSTISLKTSSLGAAEARAQANARMALMMAIGELQLQVGPDQRITANSDIISTTPVTNPHWTGVWDSWIAGDLKSAPVNATYPDAASDHQTIGAQADPKMRPNYANKFRHFRSWLLSLSPEDINNIYAPSGPKLDGKKMPQGTDNAVQLVSDGTLGNSGASADFVSARLINIAPESSQNENGGRYAWWVGDESQKASIMADSYDPSMNKTALTMAERLFRQQAPASMGNTSITGLELIKDETQLAKLGSQKTLELIDGMTSEKAQLRFHDVTTSSVGVIADVREGGLKRDLSALLERNIDPNEVYNFTYVEEFQRPTSSKKGSDDFMLYNFDSLLRSVSPTGMANVPIQDLAAYYQLYDNNRSGGKGGIQYSSTESSPPNNLLPNGAMVSTPNLGYSQTDYDKYLRQYTYQYRRLAPVKQELVLHYVTELRTAAEMALDVPGDNNYGNPYKLRIGLTPSMTFWNPNNVPVVMNSWSTFPVSPGSNLYPKQDKSSYTWIEDAIPLNLTFKRATSVSDPTPLTVTRSMSAIYDSGYQPYFYTNGNFPMIFEPGQTKVLSLQATSLSNPSGGATEINFQNRGGGGGTDNEHFLPELELAPGWLPDRFVRSTDKYGGNWGGKVVKPVLTFKATDYISVDINAANSNFGFSSISTARQNRGPYPMYSHKLFTWTPRYQANASFISDFVYMGFPRVGGGVIASTVPRPIKIPARQASSLIAAMGNPADLTDDIPQTFFYYGRKAAVETHESRNMSPPAGGAGRRFPARPFLHAPFAQSTLFDNIDGASFYDYGWNWFFLPLNNMLDAPISISGNNSGYFGGGYTAESGTTHVVQQILPLTPPISIAELSNARLGGYSLATEAPHYMGTWPFPDARSTPLEGYRRATAIGYGGLSPNGSQAIGNSYAHPSIPAGKAFTIRNRMYVQNVNTATPFADHSYLANKALWDDFFFSSITPQPAKVKTFESSSDLDAKSVAKAFFFDKKPLPNRRIQPYLAGMDETELNSLFADKDLFKGGLADKIAAHLLVNGSFNINSTSVEAWKALFSSLKGKPVAYLDKDTALTGGVNLKEDKPAGTPVGPGGAPNAKSYKGSSSDASDPEQWLGWRELTDAEIEQLAIAMVKQVKLRGPFLSLSEFVNRRLDSSKPELSVKGALQAAIDDPTIPDAKAINGGFRNKNRIFTTAEKNYFTAAFPEAMEGAIAYGSSAYVDQADILRNMAEQITPRGDTFVIRTYGDSLDAKGRVEARAWCEAVIQRVPEYIDPKDDTYLKQADLTSESNKKFGRKLQLVKFRWLNNSEV